MLDGTRAFRSRMSQILAEAIQLVQSITDLPLSIDSSIVEALEPVSPFIRRWSTR